MPSSPATSERRSDEVLPPDLDGYRERISRARAVLRPGVRLALVDRKGPGASTTPSTSAWPGVPPWAQRAMACGDVLVANEVAQL